MKLTNHQYLELLSDYFIYLYNKNSELDLDTALQRRVWKNRREAFPYVVDLFGFNEFPKVVSDEDFKKLNTPKLYRGSKDVEHIANMLCDFEYHHGTGINDGLYVSNDSENALIYTSNELKAINSDRMIMLKLDPSAKICKLSDIIAVSRHLLGYIIGVGKNVLKKENVMPLVMEKFASYNNLQELMEKAEALFDFVSNIKSNQEREIFIYSLKDEHSKLSIYFGFDAMQVTSKNFAVFNRGKFVVPQSEFNRFVENSKFYNKDGTIKRLNVTEQNSEEILQKT